MTSKKARSCDSCARRRARWYCAADDAFLCHGCDASVHSANPLARRHHRLQLRSAPNLLKIPGQNDSCPAWIRGFTRKARTPRPHNKTASSLVPELETSEENTNEEAVEAEQQQLLYRVPVYDPVLDEYCEPDPTEESKPLADYSNCNSRSSSNNRSNCLVGFLPSDTELAEFAADMESLLGRGLENDSFSMEELGLGGDADCGEQIVKEEEELDENSADAGDTELYANTCLSRETLDVDFDDCGSPTTEEEDELERTKAETPRGDAYQQRRKVGLRLDHQAIIAEWSVRGSASSPWINGERPQFGPDDCWLDYMEMWGGGDQVQGPAQAEVGGGNIDEGREARVSRYREKRRTRLFSKKIRYEVRKLNAEKRPRMKGRFVKRASFAADTPY